MTDPSLIPGATLAYLGDAVFEVITRTHLLKSGIHHAGRLNRMALDYVRAETQARGLERILPLLTEEEEAIYRKGRNAGGLTAPKHATLADYRKATGLEALFAYLYLKQDRDRLELLFSQAFPQTPRDRVIE